MRSLLLIFVFPFIQANALDTYRLKDGGLRLIGKSCSELRLEEKKICAWKQTLGEKAEIGSRCVGLGSGKYRLDTSSCVPDLLKEIHNLKVKKDGPNCWGTALSLKGYSSRPKFVWPEEIRYWLESPVCRKLAPGEKLRPGDLITSFGPEYLHEGRNALDAGSSFWDALYPGRRISIGGQIGYSGYHWNLHTETYISDSLSFGKDSPSKLDKFRFHSFSEMYGRPRARNAECQELQSKNPHYRENPKTPKNIRRSNCAYFSLAYRCGDIKSYLKGLAPNSLLHEEIKELEVLNEKLFKTLFASSPVSAELMGLIRERSTQASEHAYRVLLKIGKGELRDKEVEALATKLFFYSEGLLKFLEFQENH